MDPSTQAFTPYGSNNETWRLQSEVGRLQQIQLEHADRLTRLERKQDDDTRMKSVWGQGSPFPSVLSGTPQQAPLHHPSVDHFRGFDEDTNNLISSLHLDPEEEPRRGLGAASRANSVRFDESANQNHFNHSSRASVDMVSRASSSLGGIRMDERTSSHKSEGRASSVHSMRSAASGRASSFNLETTYGGDTSRSPLTTPAIAPGLLLLGTVPAIVRCWLDTNFKNDTLLYAGLCTGSYKSLLDVGMVQRLGLGDDVRTESDGANTLELPVYLTEAVPHPTSSRASSPAPQLPVITITFDVIDLKVTSEGAKGIQVLIGSDALRAHSADILFSSNSVTLLDDERSKLSIPLVRPENESVFTGLRTFDQSAIGPLELNGQSRTQQNMFDELAEIHKPGILSATSLTLGRYRPPGLLATESGAGGDSTASDSETRPSSRVSNLSRPSVPPPSTRGEADEQLSLDHNPSTKSYTPVQNPVTLASWRREPSHAGPTTSVSTGGLDWASASKARASEVPYQRKDAGIKILKPKTLTARTISSSASSAPVPAPPAASETASQGESRSRFFDDGRRRSGGDSAALGAAAPTPSQVVSQEPQQPPAPVGTAASSAPKAKTNPIGGASAFSWLKPSGTSSSASSTKN